MLQRVVWNCLEFRVSLPAGSIFTGEDDGFFVGFEQAQSLQARSKCLSFHYGRILLSSGHYEICP